MNVQGLKDILKGYDDEAEVIGVNWSNGETFDITVGSDDEDEITKFCRIGFE